jgi:hypothetical protein
LPLGEGAAPIGDAHQSSLGINQLKAAAATDLLLTIVYAADNNRGRRFDYLGGSFEREHP